MTANIRVLTLQSAAEKLGDLPDDAVAVVDIAVEGAEQDLAQAFAGANALVIASSAVRTAGTTTLALSVPVR
jgi:hypothetical protein